MTENSTDQIAGCKYWENPDVNKVAMLQKNCVKKCVYSGNRIGNGGRQTNQSMNKFFADTLTLTLAVIFSLACWLLMQNCYTKTKLKTCPTGISSKTRTDVGCDPLFDSMNHRVLDTSCVFISLPYFFGNSFSDWPKWLGESPLSLP